MAVHLDVIYPVTQGLVPQPFGVGHGFQVVLNATSFSDVAGQLQVVKTVAIAASKGAVNRTTVVSLLATGCSVHGGKPNCTSACASSTTMFNSSFTLWNCLTLGTLQLLATGAKQSSHGANLTVSVDAGDEAAAGLQLGFARLDNFDGAQILNDTLRCIKASCENYALGSCQSSVLSLMGEDIAASADPLADLYEGLKDYCSGAGSLVNSDIAGPGVVLSYIFQASIAVLFYVLVNLFSWLLQFILFPLFLLAEWHRFSVHAPNFRHHARYAFNAARSCQVRVSRSRPAAALASALIEFQEVQSFFVLAIQIATMIIYGGTKSTQLKAISSFSEAVVNAEVVQMMSINGVLPVLFVQLALTRRCGVQWWYMLGLVLAVCLLAVVILMRDSMQPDYDELWNYLKKTAPIQACGWNPSPMTYCLDSMLTRLTDELEPLNDALALGCVVMLLLVLDQAFTALSLRIDLSSRLAAWELASYPFLVLRRQVWPIAVGAGFAALEMALLWYLLIYIAALRQVFEAVDTKLEDWSYGQLVAVFAFIPPVGKLFYFNIFGVEEGVGKRLGPNFKVVRRKFEEDSMAGMDGCQNGKVELYCRRTDSATSHKTLDNIETKSRQREGWGRDQTRLEPS